MKNISPIDEGKDVITKEYLEKLLANRIQFDVNNRTATAYQFVKLGTVSGDWTAEGARAILTLVGKQGYNGRNCGGKIEICLSYNNSDDTTNPKIGALVYDYGYTNGNPGTISTTSVVDVLVVRASDYTAEKADIYLKFSAACNYTTFLAILEKQTAFLWVTDVSHTNTDPTVSAAAYYTAPKKVL